MLYNKAKAQFHKYPNLQILFFFDEAEKYKEELDQWGDEITLVQGTDRYFSLKYQLEKELSDQKIFLYYSSAKPIGKDWEHYPLLGLYLANKELRLDEVADFMESYNLQAHQRKLVKKYISELTKSASKKTLASRLNASGLDEPTIQKGLIATALGFSSMADRGLCLAKLLILALDEDKLSKAIAKLNLGLDEVLKGWVMLYFGEQLEHFHLDNIRMLANKLKYNVYMQAMGCVEEDSYASLKVENSADLNRLVSVFLDWQNHVQYSKRIDEVFNNLAVNINEQKLIGWYGIEAPFSYYSETMIDAVLESAASEWDRNKVKLKEDLLPWLDVEKVEQNEGIYSRFQFLIHAASSVNMLDSYASYRFNDVTTYIQKYAEELYQVDYHYRKAFYYYDRSNKDLAGISSIVEELEDKYERFLIELNNEWLELMAEQDFDYARIPAEIPRQYDFYKNYIAQDEVKKAVIISDALRFEAAQELYSELLKDSRNTAELSPCLSAIPSYTNLCMSSLLPNSGVEVSEGKTDLAYSVNGVSTAGLENRAKILINEEAESIVISAKELLAQNSNETRELLKGKKVIYIYHNVIDALGDKRGTEERTFDAVATAIEELKALIRKVHSSNVFHVYITSDHGFMFNHRKLNEATQEDRPKLEEELKKHNRFIISKGEKPKTNGYSFPLANTTNIEGDYYVTIPRSINRYKLQGAGVQFVHGGASLQEMIVPLLHYYRKREDKVAKVKVRLINSSLKIVSGALKLNFLQEQALSNKLKKVELVIGLYDNKGELLSNEVKQEFDSVSSNPKERMNSILLTLNSKGSKATICNLKVFEESDKLNPIINEKITNTTFMEIDEF